MTKKRRKRRSSSHSSSRISRRRRSKKVERTLVQLDLNKRPLFRAILKSSGGVWVLIVASVALVMYAVAIIQTLLIYWQ